MRRVLPRVWVVGALGGLVTCCLLVGCAIDRDAFVPSSAEDADFGVTVVDDGGAPSPDADGRPDAHDGGVNINGGPTGPAPVVTSVTPSTLAHGAPMRLAGRGLRSATRLSIGGKDQIFRFDAGDLVVDAIDDDTAVGTQDLVVDADAAHSAPVDVIVIRLLLSEIDLRPSDYPRSRLQIVELGTGVPGANLGEYLLIAHGPDAAYGRLPLQAQGDENGIVLLRFPDPLLRGAAGAVALYQHYDSDDDHGEPIDAVVYGDDSDADELAGALLLPGGNRSLDEGSRGHRGDDSIQRCGSRRRDSRSFVVGTATPGVANGCL